MRLQKTETPFFMKDPLTFPRGTAEKTRAAAPHLMLVDGDLGSPSTSSSAGAAERTTRILSETSPSCIERAS